MNRYPPTDDDKKQKLGAFFGKNPPTRIAPMVPDYIKAAQAKYPSIKSWNIVGVRCNPSTPSQIPSHAQLTSRNNSTVGAARLPPLRPPAPTLPSLLPPPATPLWSTQPMLPT